MMSRKKERPKQRKDPGKIFTSEWQVSADPMLWFAPVNKLRWLRPQFLSFFITTLDQTLAFEV